MTSRNRLLSLLILTILLAGCEFHFAEHANVTVAPHLGQSADCVPYEELPADAAAWLRSNPNPAPAGWKKWKDEFIIGKVQPKLAKDCGEDTR